MRKARHGVGGALFVISQICAFVLWIVYVNVWMYWQGGLGFLIGLMTVPGVVVFPVMFYMAENRWPVGYLVLWAITIGLWVASAFTIGEE